MNVIKIPERVIKTKNSMGQIYIIRNYVNDKVYIGETTIGYKARFVQHCKQSTRTQRHYKLYEAMNKYGVDKFYVELLEENVPINKMYEKEIFYIKKYNSFYNGYNSTKGGDGRFINTTSSIEYIINEYQKGKTTGDIAKIFNVNPVTIERTLKRYNIPLRKDGSKIDLINKNEFIKMWNDGVLISDMARHFSVDERTVRRYVPKLGLRFRRNWTRLRKEDDQPTLFD